MTNKQIETACASCNYTFKGDPLRKGAKHRFKKSLGVVGNNVFVLARLSDIIFPVWRFITRPSWVKNGYLCDDCLRRLITLKMITFEDDEPGITAVGEN